MARVIAVINQKGGTGKTTTAVNLSAYLAALGKRVLLVDFDPQGNASSGLGHHHNLEDLSIYHGLIGQTEPEKLIRGSAVMNLHYIPANNHLAGALIELVSAENREYFLRRFLNNLRHQYHYIFIDLPPSLSLLTVNGMVASDEVLIPVQAEYYSLEGLSQLLETIYLIQNNLAHPLKITGALITMYDKREKLSREVTKEIRRHFRHHVFESEIPRAVALAEAPSFGKPIILYNSSSPGAIAYQRLAREIIEQEKQMSEVERGFGNFNIRI
ncbi:MAG: hypothetical protein A2430_00845 [Candidatus Liptonbacteria bacterium RIFOXYC1_FULL_36_8]|uniref:AAA domain-containing protein n=3 Tax=Candidatus Liptoniibacteriota TaxID=1817909 RepID=A0A1G2CQA6_9BACT|nr:MAG: hypothetical protein A2390_03165 [Candidatus Liptonbacteria bacterium RIFOXYB1_FULL_36_10]OGZ03852.1 MAG: hypothetical protein A2430_00845 [Candidatus Liptonbacteria bacterium RIFOXYC1_FULL_36_8]OGZ04286.1 MAG: hypothetical protein A2604_00735 [Candidatus Liptonbacteria bacterium RIFOXYD1_FULL_36_11]